MKLPARAEMKSRRDCLKIAQGKRLPRQSSERRRDSESATLGNVRPSTIPLSSALSRRSGDEGGRRGKGRGGHLHPEFIVAEEEWLLYPIGRPGTAERGPAGPAPSGGTWRRLVLWEAGGEIPEKSPPDPISASYLHTQ
jgi:hypothetical protein